jgi:putative SOS response-associated peptidase YedK
MCGRYVLASPGEAIAEHFRLAAMPDVAPHYNIAPTQFAPVIRATKEGARELVAMRWGLVPGWADDLSIGARLINARAETVTAKPAFRAAFRHRRCLIPASGFYEWKPAGKRKQPYFCRLAGRSLFAMAGLWEEWRSPDGEVVKTYTVITTDANADMKAIHDRMPAIVFPDAYAAWLSAPDPSPLLVPLSGARLDAYPVGLRVNNVRNDDAALLEPAEAGSEPL